MSYLSRPRAYFSGKYVVNTATGNNSTSDYNNQVYFDVAGVKLDLNGKTPQQFREWFMQLTPNPDPSKQYVNAFWDYFGDNTVSFEKMAVTGVELQHGGLITNPAQDALIGGSVNLAGNLFGDVRTGAIMVDTDPVDAFTSQIFSDLFSVTDASSNSLMEGTGSRKAYSYWLNFWRNLVEGGDNGCSAVWQIALPNSGLNFPALNNSPFLQQLQQSAQQGQGVVVRFCTYLFQHISYQDIEQRFQQGNYDPTSARMIIVGTIGPWAQDEPESVPMARILNPNVAMPLPVSQWATPVPDSGKLNFWLGPALAQVDTTRKVVTLDLVSTFPEAQPFDTMQPNNTPANTPDKINMGTLALRVRNQDPTQPGVTIINWIGNLPFQGSDLNQPAYNKAAYLARAGIVEIPYDPAIESAILSGDLILSYGTQGKAPSLLEENPIAILTDWRGIYLEGEQQGQATPIPLQVLLRGKPAPAGLTFALTQTVNPDYPTASTTAQAIQSKPTAHTRFRLTRKVVDATDQIVAIPASITTDANGCLSLPITPVQQGLCKIWVQTQDDPDISSLNQNDQYFMQGETWYYVNVRVLPDDRSLDSVTHPDWAYMYANFFGYYSLLYPAMNTHVNFDDEQSTTAAATLIKNFVSTRAQNSTLYMPITRELSAGKRRLVQRWASQHE